MDGASADAELHSGGSDAALVLQDCPENSWVWRVVTWHVATVTHYVAPCQYPMSQLRQKATTMAGMAAPSIGQATSRELKRVLSEVGWSVTRAGQELDVSRRQVQRWLAGTPMPWDHIETLCERSGKAVHIEVGEHEEAPRPEWAEELVADVKAIRRGVESEANGLAVLKALLEAIQTALGQSPDDPADDLAPPQTRRKRGR
jgi:hypothetical protein